MNVGDIVLYEMPKDWHPELGIRIYPAAVLYPNGAGLDLQVFCQPYEGVYGYRVQALRGEGPGTWQPKQATRAVVELDRVEPEPITSDEDHSRFCQARDGLPCTCLLGNPPRTVER